ncbi:PfkB family carbohydrate kinase [Kineococcus glutinatus]|uniref:PfkB family carbohydrate kinase n=1 Tax=Kineococcus glutinatus TaxID=1070872 RepID=A0ABP9H8G1_9ACTN
MPDVVVFAPAPSLRVTAEPAPDGSTEIHLHPGGQGVWAGRMARTLEAAVTLSLPLGGESGVALRALLEHEGQRVLVTGTAGPTPTVVLDHGREPGGGDAEGGRVVAQSHGALTRHEVDELYTRTLEAALSADVVVLTGVENPGTLDESIYTRLARDLRANGPAVVADLSGAALLAAVEGGLSVLKTAHDELVETQLCEGDEPEQLLDAARELQERGAEVVLVSRAGEPALLLDAEGRAFALRGPELTVVQHRGAGDSMCGALAVAVASGADAVSAARLATAAGALNVTRQGLGTGHADAIRALAKRVEVRELH